MITEALTTICRMLEEKYGSYRFVPGADNSPPGGRPPTWLGWA